MTSNFRIFLTRLSRVAFHKKGISKRFYASAQESQNSVKQEKNTQLTIGKKKSL